MLVPLQSEAGTGDSAGGNTWEEGVWSGLNPTQPRWLTLTGTRSRGGGTSWKDQVVPRAEGGVQA